MKFKLGIINNNNKKLEYIDYSNLENFIKKNIIDKILIEDYEFENLNKLIFDFYKNDEITKKSKKINFEILHCYENEKYCFYCIYPYGKFNIETLNRNYNAEILSRNKEIVLSKMIIMKFNINEHKYDDLTLEDLITIYKNHFIFNSIYINKNNKILTNIEFLSMEFENEKDSLLNPAIILNSNDIKIKNISHKHGIINIMFTEKKEKKTEEKEEKTDDNINEILKLLNEEEKQQMNNNFNIIDNFISAHCPNYNNCIINYYYFYNGQYIIYKIDVDILIKIINNINILENNDNELYIYNILSNKNI